MATNDANMCRQHANYQRQLAASVAEWPRAVYDHLQNAAEWRAKAGPLERRGRKTKLSQRLLKKRARQAARQARRDWRGE
jgi:hypothetical protein